MSSPSDWPRPDHNSHSRETEALLPTHLLMTTRYGPRPLAAVTKGRFMVYGPYIEGLILQRLCLELGLLCWCGGHPQSGACTEQISAKAPRRGRHDVYWVAGAARAAREGKRAVEPAAAVYGAEDDNDIHLLWVDVEWRFVVCCIASTTFASTSTASAFSTWPHTNSSEDILDTDADQCL